jgi:hypothetical protein
MLNITDGFYVNYAAPVDYRMIATNSTVRNSIVYKYDGMKVFQTDDRNTYVWTTSSSSWIIEYSTMIIGTGSLNYVPKVVSTFPYVSYDNSSIYVNSGGYVGIGTNDPKEYFQIGPSSPPPGISQPLTIHKGGVTTIGSNWYFSVTDQYFSTSTTDGSSNIVFGSDGSILIRNRPANGSSMVSSIQFNSDRNTYILQNTLYLKGITDTYNGLKWSSSFGNVSVMNGPSLFGQTGGVLGTRSTSSVNTAVIYWKETEIQLLKDTYMSYNTLYLTNDQYHGIGYRSSFGGYTLDGPAIFGFNSGVLGTNNFGTQNVALHWNSSNNVGIGTASNTIYKLKANGVIQGRSVLTKMVGGVLLNVGSSVYNADVHLITGHLATSFQSPSSTTITNATYSFIQSTRLGSVDNIGTTAWNMVLQPGGGNVRIGTSTTPDQSIYGFGTNVYANYLFPYSSPKLEILTGSNGGTYSECVVIRHDGISNTPDIKRLGLIMKMSGESDVNESAKMGGMMLESNQNWSNAPSLYFLTANQKRLGIDYNGNVDVISGNVNISTGDLYVNSGDINISTGSLNVSTIYGIASSSYNLQLNGNVLTSGNILRFNNSGSTGDIEVNGYVRMLNTSYPRVAVSISGLYSVYTAPLYNPSLGTYRLLTSVQNYSNTILPQPYDRYIYVTAQMQMIYRGSINVPYSQIITPSYGQANINFSIGTTTICNLKTSVWFHDHAISPAALKVGGGTIASVVGTVTYDNPPNQYGSFFVPAGVSVNIYMSAGIPNGTVLFLIDEMIEFRLGK